MSQSSASADALTKYLDKHLDIKMNGKRRVQGVLRGYDQYMNVVLEEAVEYFPHDVKEEIGTVILRGNAIVMIECKEHVEKTIYNTKVR